ncbi:response regulator transcription factor [Parvularcula flava]|uniref:DNA-binding response regulator n=1 Tax=Aquisalinus luteolus TaxID=1566827 RepID=A0A8J3EPS6_9PROT|nr:LytTR family DNA-binding domain-containing protein [Aquisalinus luteolus]NHK26348.1 response regulator transcription factor [Aquisalinus luteolus]GGH92061.1 DNA-binding response regulator [Aquisalinus luteolus]
MKPHSVLIVDDEPLARRRLRHGLDGIEGIGAISEARDGAEALHMIEDETPDIILLDIKMPRMNGFDLVSMLTERDCAPAIIFVTAFDNYAVRAFERDAIDYLLKPVAFARLKSAIARARERLEQVSAIERVKDLQKTLATLNSGRDETAKPEIADFWIKDRDVITRVTAASIIWIEAERDYVRLHLDGRTHLMRSTLTSVEEKLPESAFLRVHRSAIVNRRQIESLSHSSTGAYTLHLRNGDSVPVGRSYKKQILAEIEETRKGSQ